MTSHWVYVTVAWVAVLGGTGGYAASVVARGRKLSRQVPPEDRRWS